MPPTLVPRGGAPVQLPTSHSLAVRPVGGLNTSLPAKDIQDGESPLMSNLQVMNGTLRKRPGYTQWPAGQSAAANPILGMFVALDSDGVQYFYAAAKNKLAKLNPGAGTWDTVTGASLTGGDQDVFCFAVSQNALVFSQGVDGIWLSALTSSTYAALNANAPPTRSMERFAERLICAYMIESGAKPYRSRWCVNNDHTNWTATGSGFHENSDYPSGLRGLKRLVNTIALYYENMIELGAQTGTIPPLQFDVVVPDCGLLAPRTLRSFRELHIFLGTDNFYTFNGSAIIPIANTIRNVVFDTINPNKPRMHFAVTNTRSQEYLAFLAANSYNVPSSVFVYNWGSGVWYPWTVGVGSVSGPASNPISGCLYTLDSSKTIDQLIGTVDDQTWTFDDYTVLASAATMFTGHDDGIVYKWGNEYLSDNGYLITCEWHSKDFVSENLGSPNGYVGYSGPPGHIVSLDRITFEYFDHGVPFTLTFMFSVDGGTSWTQQEIVTVGGGATGWKLGEVTRKVSGPRIRFKFQEASLTSRFTLGTFYLSFTTEEAMIA